MPGIAFWPWPRRARRGVHARGGGHTGLVATAWMASAGDQRGGTNADDRTQHRRVHECWPVTVARSPRTEPSERHAQVSVEFQSECARAEAKPRLVMSGSGLHTVITFAILRSWPTLGRGCLGQHSEAVGMAMSATHCLLDQLSMFLQSPTAAACPHTHRASTHATVFATRPAASRASGVN